MQGDKITFFRTKTKRSNRSNLKKIVVFLTAEAMAIINKWGTDKEKDLNIFPFYKEGITEREKYNVSKHQIKNLNKWMGVISKDLGFDFKVTFYYARHSFATILRNSGASIEYISGALGHTEIKSTQLYIDSFEESKVKEFNSRLLDPDFRSRLKVSYKAD